MASLLNLFKSCRPFTPSFPRSHFTSPLRIQLPLRPGRLTQPRRSFTPLSSSSSHPSTNPTTNNGDSIPGVKELWLHNTMSRKKEVFKPKVDGQVGMYVCGVTAYDLSHIGHARVYVTFDVLFRYLKHLGYQVSYVRNFTDVDDKIIARANELGEDPISLSRRFCEEFNRDMEQLQCLDPSVEPRVSDHIPQIIDLINQILDNGYAYEVDGDVYFSVDKFPTYGKLSGRKLEDNRAGERVAVDTRKRHPADFALWKTAKEGEVFWESPWGRGRPGWHIECSAMSAAYLGYSFDIHGGGMDLVFPHHENEIAQSCAACDSSDISYWIHNGFVTVDSEKMSKSLGNFFTIRQTLHDCESVLGEKDSTFDNCSVPSDTLTSISTFRSEFVASMSDDLLTPVTLAAMSEPLKTINDLIHTRKVKHNLLQESAFTNHRPPTLFPKPINDINDFDFQGKKQPNREESLKALETSVREVLTILGLMPTSYSEVLEQLKEKALKRAGLKEEDVLERVKERTDARKNKEYERSDAIRKELANVGIALMDSPEGTTWRPAIPLALQEPSTTT
ncbi:hypothetical protein Bca4012_036656 [Brassica carinata]